MAGWPIAACRRGEPPALPPTQKHSHLSMQLSNAGAATSRSVRFSRELRNQAGDVWPEESRSWAKRGSGRQRTSQSMMFYVTGGPRQDSCTTRTQRNGCRVRVKLELARTRSGISIFRRWIDHHVILLCARSCGATSAVQLLTASAFFLTTRDFLSFFFSFLKVLLRGSALHQVCFAACLGRARRTCTGG